MKIYRKAGLLTLLTTVLFAPTALAQSTGYASDAVLFGNSDPFQNIGLNAGFNVTVPLGARHSKQNTDKARFGLKLSLAQSSYYASSPQTVKLGGDLLELGLNFDGSPNLQMHGQDIYAPLFGPLHASEGNEEEQNKPKPKGNGTEYALIAVAGVVTLGTIVLVSEIADDIDDCFFRITDDPKCS